MELLELEMRARYEKIMAIIRGRNFCVGYPTKEWCRTSVLSLRYLLSLIILGLAGYLIQKFLH